jgi:hypothetical protein
MKRGTNNNQNKELTRGDALVPDTSRGCRAEQAGEIKNYPEEEVEGRPHLGLSQPLQQRVELSQPPPRIFRSLALLAVLPRRREADYVAARPHRFPTHKLGTSRVKASSSHGARGDRPEAQLHSGRRDAGPCVWWTVRAGVDNDLIWREEKAA